MSEDAELSASLADIAIVGLAGRFPGARTPDELWRNVAARVESIRAMSDDELTQAGVPRADSRAPSYVRAAATLAGVEHFDEAFFGFSPRDAAILDPQHRHFLECAWEALEDSGHLPETFAGAIGVYGGCGMNAYFMFNLLSNPSLVAETGLFLLRHTGNDKDFLTTRVSYELGLTGPSVGIQTACSTSLVAVHVACQQLLARECDLALAGGVTIEIPHGRGYHFEAGGIASPDGHCRAFDAAARGTVFGSGVGIVALRRLADAVADGDHIRAVIRGSAVNNDGRGKVGYLAPSVDGQAAAIREALDVAGVAADRISYVEAHGTGTPVGDPIEIAALTQAFAATTDRRGYCAIGSLKTNIGHLDTAAGVAGLIKTVKALEHRQLPPSLHFAAPNPAIDFDATPFVVNTELRPWPAEGGPRLATVNSLGVGGTNAHIVLQEAPPAPPASERRGPWILPISARTPAALERAAGRLAAHLTRHPELPMAAVADTLQVGRRAFAHRRALVATGAADAIEMLRMPGSPRQVHATARQAPPRIVFMFPGGGAQYVGMGRELYAEEPVFRDAVDACARLVSDAGGPDVVAAMFATESEFASQALSQPQLSVLSVFIVEYALSRLFASWGITPDVVMGHSLGEYVAAHLAGVMSLQDALAIVMARGAIFEQATPGAMLSVALPVAALAARLPGGAGIAAVNAPAATVASGTTSAIEALERELIADAIECQRVRIGVAAHSALLAPHLDGFRAFVGALTLHPPTLPVFSNVSGAAADDAMSSPDYWVRHLREPVRFADAVAAVGREGPAVFVEVGPGRALTSFVRQCDVPGLAVATMRHHQESMPDRAAALVTVAALWTAGVPVDWSRVSGGERPRRVPLPTYPFEPTAHWIAPGAPAAAAEAPLLPRAEQLEEWFFEPAWREVPLPERPASPPATILWVGHPDGRGQPYVAALRRRGHDVHEITVGSGTQPVDPAELGRLLAAPLEVPAHVVFDAIDPEAPIIAPLRLAQTIGAADADRSLTWWMVTRDLWCVDDGETTGDPRQAVALGPALVLPREYPTLRSRAVDLASNAAASQADAFAAEFDGGASDPITVLRGARRFVAASVPAAPQPSTARVGDAALVTGAFGGLGRLVSRWAAAHFKGPLLLVTRQAPSDVEAELTAHRALGASPYVIECDVADGERLTAALAALPDAAGRLARVFHLAGTIDDGATALKSPAAAAAVLRPKVEGTLALLDVLRRHPIDDFVLFSSTSAFLGLPGQADYSAANLFLRAIADSPAGRRAHARVLYWGAWQRRGMVTRPRPALASPTAAGHPLLGEGAQHGEEWRFEALHHEGSWWYDEHRTARGVAVLPGTAWLELLRAAGTAVTGRADCAVEDVRFLRPLELAIGEARLVTTLVEPAGDTWRVRATSRPSSGGEIEHVEAVVRRATVSLSRLDPSAIERRCDRRALDRDAALAAQRAHMSFGPRWSALRTVRYGEAEALAILALTPQVADDCTRLPLHPALLDSVVAAASELLPGAGSGLLVPFGVGRVRMVGPLPEAPIAHVLLREGATSQFGALDIVVADRDGRSCCLVENLTLRRVDAATFVVPARPAAPAPWSVLIDQGIADDEGSRALEAVLAAQGPRHLVVSPFAPAGLLDAVRRWWPPATPQRAASPAPAADQASDLEGRLAEIWRELLGVDTISLDADFFEQGGHSLLGVRLFARIEKRLGHRLDLATLFTARTIRTMAARIREASAPKWRALVPVQPSGSAPPFFLVHGVGGEVMSFRDLAEALGADQPLYGFRAVAYDGASAPQTTISEQAETYVAEMLTHQPQGPFDLGGYSHGARVAFEMARQLRASGHTVRMLALMDTWPSDREPRGVTYPVRFVANLPRWFWHDVVRSTRHENLDRVRRGFARLKGLGAPSRPTGAEIAGHMDVRELPDVVRAVYEANFQAFSGYEPGPYDGHVTVFRAAAQPVLTPLLTDHGWHRYAPSVQVIGVPGNHLSMIRPPNVQALARALSAALAAAREAAPA